MKISLALLSLFVALVFSQNCPPDECDPDDCYEPDCACSDSIPNVGGGTVKDLPMIVYLTFDDALTELASSDFYEEVFGPNTDYLNPNGCPIRATHFLTHQYTDYSLVNKWYSRGHEIATHSISHRANTTYWANMNKDQWRDEMAGMRTIAANLANIPEYAITGIRAPYLQGGGDAQFEMMMDEGFIYDCTMPSREFGYIDLDKGRWPHTLDFRSDMDCQIEPCPTCDYPGIWNQPILDLQDSWIGTGDDGNGSPCGMLDSCICNECSKAEEIRDMLVKNFEKAYNGLTRAPMGLYMHAAWFFGQEFHYEGYKMALRHMLSYNDTWIVPVSAGIKYRQEPMSLPELWNNEFEPFQCDNFPPPSCSSAKSCRYTNVVNEDLNIAEIYMKSCVSCPTNYPWLGNPEGN